MSSADIAGNGAVWVGLEDTYGTPVDPTDAGVGVWMPIISETLAYTESKYYTEQIRASAISSDVEQAPYHVAGDIVMEVDANYMPYLMCASRHLVQESGAGPYNYVATPTSVGSTYPGGSAKGLSICVVRNGIGFLYGGCVGSQWAFTIENGVLRLTLSVLGLSEQDTSSEDFSGMSWVDADLFGASAHTIYVDSAGDSPTFASADNTFNGYTFTANYNGAAQNRIQPNRAATFISYGAIEATYDTELDFLTKEEYNNMKNNELRSIKLESIKGGVDWASATRGFRVIANNTSYNTYEMNLSGMGDLIMARVNGRSLGITGGVPFSFECISPVDLGL